MSKKASFLELEDLTVSLWFNCRSTVVPLTWIQFHGFSMTQVFVGGSSFEIDFRQFDKKFTGFFRSLMDSRNKSVEIYHWHIEQLPLESRYMDRVVMTAITNRFAWKCYCFQVVPKTECLHWLPLSFCEREAIELKVCERQIGKKWYFPSRVSGGF